MNTETLRKYATLRAQDCIDDWAHEGWYELNEVWDTDFTEDELREISRLASTAKAIIP